MRLRKPLRDVIAANQKSLDMYAALSGKPRFVLRPEAPKREIVNRRTDGGEAAVIKAVSDWLALNSFCLLALRQNSGTAQAIGSNGQPYPIWFYRLLRNRRDVTITDFWGITNDFRLFALEAKAPFWPGPKTEREGRQANFIALVRESGGRGGFITSVDEAEAILR